MKIAAVICECNPFHNGHAYLFRTLRERYGVDFVVALMSGNFVQRGEPAIMDKYTRTRMTLTGDSAAGGYADLVLEIPTVFSTASAREFAAAGVSMALHAGIIDLLGFGTEGGISPESLREQSRNLPAADDPDNDAASGVIRAALRSGMSYPAAIGLVTEKPTGRPIPPVQAPADAASPVSSRTGRSVQSSYTDQSERYACTDRSGQPSPDAAAQPTNGGGIRTPHHAKPPVLKRPAADSRILSSPNNILAAEYLRALAQFDSTHRIIPVFIPRVGDPYAASVPSDQSYCSARALRRMLLEAASMADTGSILPYVPAPLHSLYEELLSRCIDISVHPSKSDNAPCGINGLSDSRLGLSASEKEPCKGQSHIAVNSLVTPDMLSGCLNKALLDAAYRCTDLTAYADVSREIANRLLCRADIPMRFTDRIADTKTRQYTYTRISRALLHIALGMTKTEFEQARNTRSQTETSTVFSPDTTSPAYIHYLRILGFRKDAAPLLKALKSNADVPIVTKTADHKELLKQQLYYDQLYNALSHGRNEYECPPVIL